MLGQVRSRESVLSIKLGCHRQLCQVSLPLVQVNPGGLVRRGTKRVEQVLDSSRSPGAFEMC